MNTSGIPSKSGLRAAVRARRTARAEASAPHTSEPPAPHADQVARLVASCDPVAVVGYAALPGEPSLDDALAALLATGTPVLLPATRKGEPLRLGRVTGSLDDLSRGTWGIREPAAPRSAPEALAGSIGDVQEASILVLVPGLSYDARGTRLGNGGGFYDRTFGPQGLFADDALAPLRARLRFVGVCWDDERTTALPREEWDLTVSAILTETGVHAVTGSAAHREF